MLVSLHEHFKIRVTDWLLSAILLSWGFGLFAVDPRAWNLPLYAGLNSIASQGTWAATATMIGTARLCALFVNGAVRRSPHLRLIGAFLTIFIWLQLSLTVFCTAPVGPSVAIFPWLVVADIFNVYRAAVDARTSDHAAHQKNRIRAARHAPSA